MDKTLSTENWARICLQNAIIAEGAANGYLGKEVHPCSVCYFALDACSAFLQDCQDSYGYNHLQFSRFETNSKMNGNYDSTKEDGGTRPEVKQNPEANDIFFVPSNALHSPYHSSMSRSLSSRSRLSSYSSMTTSSMEDHVPSPLEYSNIVVRHTAEIKNDNCDREKNQTPAKLPIDASLKHLTPQTNQPPSTNKSSAGQLSDGPCSCHQESSSGVSDPDVLVTNSCKNINHVNGESQPIELCLDKDTYIPEENDGEIFDEYMREIYATNMYETFEHDVEETKDDRNQVIDWIENGKSKLLNGHSLAENVNSNIFTECKKRGENTKNNSDEYEYAENIFSPSLKSIWNVFGDTDDIFAMSKNDAECQDQHQDLQENVLCITETAMPRHNHVDTHANKDIEVDVDTQKPKRELRNNANMSQETFCKISTESVYAVEPDEIPVSKGLRFTTRGTNTDPDLFFHVDESKDLSSKATCDKDVVVNFVSVYADTSTQTCEKGYIEKHNEQKNLVSSISKPLQEMKANIR